MPQFALRHAIVALPLAVALLAGCSKAPDGQSVPPHAPTAVPDPHHELDGNVMLSSFDPTVQLPAVPGRPAVAYFKLVAGRGFSDKVVGVSAAHFAHAEIHESKMEGGVMTMAPVNSLAILPGETILFAPAGLHVMLFESDGRIKAGDTTELTLKLVSGLKIVLQAKVTAQGDGAMAGMKM